MKGIEYLLIPHQYMQRCGDLRFSDDCEAIVGRDGTLLLAASLAQFLEGAGANGRLPHFAFVLHFLRLLLGTDGALHAAWTESGRNFRNAGALFAELARALPRTPVDLNVRKLATALRRPADILEVHYLARAAQTPPLEPAQFADHIGSMLASLSPADLCHWLRHGRGPVVAPGQIPEIPPPPKRTLGGAVQEALQRKRMAGVAPFVDRMVSALTLPPRKAVRSELPVGGYASVINRGQPDQILFSEFAGDELEFLRRYAENELLYWQREEPQTQVREDLLVVLDQGVRTWGEPRLLLAAAAVAMAKRAERRGLPVRFAGTSSGGRAIDPIEGDLAALLEASDFSVNPGEALETALSEPTFDQRDVVLLTHSLSLAEPDVRVAARRAGQGVRVFALGVDADGTAELVELRRGAPVPVRSFRIPIEAPPKPAEATPKSEEWQGPLEPVPMPFRFGIAGSLHSLALDGEGTAMLTVSSHGLLQLWPTDGRVHEHIPRPMHEGKPLDKPMATCGVLGGFVVGYAATQPVVAHIDCTAHRVRVLPLGQVPNAALFSLAYLPTDHCVVVRGAGWERAIDLPAGEAITRGGNARIEHALGVARVAGECLLPPRVNVLSDRSLSGDALANAPVPKAPGCRFVIHNPGRGEVALGGSVVCPRRDGRPLLKDARLLEGVSAAGTVALRANRDGVESVLVFAGGKLKAELHSRDGALGMAISEDGEVLAVRDAAAHAAVLRVNESAKPVATAASARVHSELALDAGDNWFTVYGGKFTHLVRWDRGRLEISFLQGRQEITTFISRRKDCATLNPRLVRGRWGVAGACSYDAARFRQYAMAPGGLTFQTDIYGQIAVLGRDNKLVAMFFVYRGTVAAWLPDGTRYGPASITGGPTTPGALNAIGAALAKGGA